MDLHLTFGGSAYLLLLSPLLVTLAVYAYRRPDRPMSRALRALLLLRVAALLIAVALLVEPLFALTIRRPRPPTVVLLLDDSASMTIEDTGTERRKVLLDLLQNPQVSDALTRIGDLRAFAFADSLRALDFKRLGPHPPPGLLPLPVGEGGGDQRLSPATGEGEVPSPLTPLRWDGPATDLGSAFTSLRERFKGQDLSALVLISDGATNVGVDAEKAASALGVPVYAVGVGNPKEPKDVAVLSALCDPVGAVGQETSVRVTVRSSGYAGLRLPVELRVSGRLILAQPILLEDGEQQMDLPLKPETPGRQTCEVRIPPQPDERSAANNSATFSLEVLKGKTRVLLVAGSPDPDFGYLRRLLTSDKTTQIEAVVAAARSGFSRQDAAHLTALKGYDLVALLDLPSSALAGTDRALADFVRAGGGLLVVGGRNAFDRGYGTSALRDILPVRVVESGPSFQEDRFQIEFLDAVHPILRLSDDPDADARARTELPPLLSLNRTLGARPGATVLAVHPRLRTPDGARMPLIAAAASGAGKAMAVSCATLYRLNALMWGIGKTGEVADALWKNAFRWLLTPESARRVRVVADRPVWRGGEPVTLHASVYDPLMRPQRGAVVTVTISEASGPRTATLVESGEGRYVGQVRGLSPGDHRFEGRAEVESGAEQGGGTGLWNVTSRERLAGWPHGSVRQGDLMGAFGRVEVGRDAGTFTVSAAGLEFETLRMNEDLLRRIAHVSGGAFYRPADFPSFMANLKLAQKTTSEVHRAQLWGNPYALAAFVALLAVEWTLRRRRGML